ncbi:MAG: hypothetical protein GQ574_18455 [Crocinitomix sp.]|nr:hypothetical protein [Crocinitomix sp.]
MVNYWVTIENTGTTIPSGTIVLELDPAIEFVSSEIEPESIVGNKITWAYEDLMFFETLTIPLVVLFPVPDDVGEIVTNTVTSIIGIPGDEEFT